MKSNKKFRFRMIVPAFPAFNIYTFAARTTTSAGPIYLATAANKLELWEAEVIDENNLHGKYYPRDKSGKLDHVKLQQERPADVVGFYGSISSAAPRLYELAALYKSLGVLTVSGGKHVENMPEEALANHIDLIGRNEGEQLIRELLLTYQKGGSIEELSGIYYLKDGQVITTPERPLLNELNTLPLPDFSLLRYAKIHFYPISRTRGCNSKCEFCAVKDRARCASPQWLMEQIRHLAETRGATHFFEASDHFAANIEEAIEFCRLYADYQRKIGKRFVTTIQIRITDARYPELLQAMKDANINTCAIGYESPIDEDLIAMKKGYLSKHLVEWTHTFHKYGFFINGMFIFGYPKKDKNMPTIPLKEQVRRFKRFIKEAKIDTVQMLLTIPLPGTELRARLERENRLYPLEKIGWEYYDGQFPLFEPDDGISPEELQKAMASIMKGFYHFRNFLKLVKNILFVFPGMMFLAIFSLVTGKVRYLTKVFRIWNKIYFRNYKLRFGGYLVIQNWFKHFRKSNFLQKLKEAREELKKKAEQSGNRRNALR